MPVYCSESVQGEVGLLVEVCGVDGQGGGCVVAWVEARVQHHSCVRDGW